MTKRHQRIRNVGDVLEEPSGGPQIASGSGEALPTVRRGGSLPAEMLDRTKVCFVCPNILPLFGIPAAGGFGGAEIQIRQIARYLREEGCQVDVLVSTELGPEAQIIDGLRLIPAIEETLTSGAIRSAIAKLTLVKALRRSGADVYVSTCAAPDAGLVSIYARLSRKAFIYRVAHETDCDGTFERRNGWRGRLFGLGLRSADVVVAQHADQAAQLAKRGIASTIIHNSFKMPLEHGGISRDIDCLWVGRSEPWKRPFLFLELARRLPGRQFTMVCAVKRGQEQLFEHLCSSARELPNVSFVQGVAFADSQAYFDRAKILIGTSEAEGFPNTYIQACIAGTPISTFQVDPERFVEVNDCGRVAHGDLGRLIEGIEGLLTNPQEWSACSRNASSYARREHNVEVEGGKWAMLVRSLRKAPFRNPGRDAPEAMV